MKRIGILIAAALLLAGCNLRYALFGFPVPVVNVAGTAPIELEYREAKGGLVILRGRVNGKADVDFILDTGAPVTVLIDGARTAALGLDSSRARPLGDPAARRVRLHEPAAWAAPRGAAAVPIAFRGATRSSRPASPWPTAAPSKAA